MPSSPPVASHPACSRLFSVAPGGGPGGVLLVVLVMLVSAVPLHGQESREAQLRRKRQEKAEQVRAPERGTTEAFLLRVERSNEEGFLGVRLLGVPVYGWLLGLAGIVLAGGFLYGLRRLVRRVRAGRSVRVP